MIGVIIVGVLVFLELVDIHDDLKQMNKNLHNIDDNLYNLNLHESDDDDGE